MALGALVLSGCQSLPRQERAADVPGEVERMATLGDHFDQAEFSIASGAAQRPFTLRPQTASEPLPGGFATTVSVTEGGLQDALQLLVGQTNLGMVVEGGPRALERYGATSAFVVSGTFPELMERLSHALGFFYALRDGVIHVTPEDRFVVDLPPALSEDNVAGIANTLQHLGAFDLYLDRLNRTVTFRTNRSGLRSIENYLQHLRTTRSMLLYDVHVYQVDLSDGQDSGVKWNQFGWTGSSAARAANSTTGATSTGTGVAAANTTGDITAPFGSANRATTFASGAGSSGYGLGAVIAGPRFNMDVLVDFLKTQGNVRAISQPRIALMSGSKGSLRVGQSTTYVAKVGSNIGTNLNQVTVETQSVLTGFELTLFGEEHEGSIFTRINLNLAELLNLNKFTALGTDLTLPQTAEREVRTTVRARPGDVVLLGGIATQRDSLDVLNGLGGTRKAGSAQRAELVIALRPRIVRFGDAGAGPLPPAPNLPARLVMPDTQAAHPGSKGESK